MQDIDVQDTCKIYMQDTECLIYTFMHRLPQPPQPKARLAAAETIDAKFCTERLIYGWCFCCFVFLLMCAAATPKHTPRIAANNLHSHVKALCLMPLQQYLFAHLCMTSLTLVTLR